MIFFSKLVSGQYTSTEGSWKRQGKGQENKATIVVCLFHYKNPHKIDVKSKIH
jgi:hypothetical protein